MIELEGNGIGRGWRESEYSSWMSSSEKTRCFISDGCGSPVLVLTKGAQTRMWRPPWQTVPSPLARVLKFSDVARFLHHRMSDAGLR